MQVTVDSEEKRKALVEYIMVLSLCGKTWVCSVAQRRTKRSLPQNRLYHAWLRLLSDETGNDVDMLHRYFATRFIGPETVDIGGELVSRPMSTTLLDTATFAAYLDRIEAWAAEQGYDLPRPGDTFFEDMYEKYGGVQT